MKGSPLTRLLSRASRIRTRFAPTDSSEEPTR
jgi:hypothetical protein